MKKRPGKILIIDDDEHVLFTSQLILKDYFEVVSTLTSPITLESVLRESVYEVILLDMNFKAGITNGNEGIFWMNKIARLSPDTCVVLQTAYGDIELAVKSMKEGAVDFLPKPWDKEKLVSTCMNAYNVSAARKQTRPGTRQNPISDQDLALNFIASSESMQTVLETITQVAPTTANILLLGENGTGKELVARKIHANSDRCNAPFVTVDVGAIPASLFESELFGHGKGAFTDAKEPRLGKFELANKGTLFLDEIGNIPIELQAKLLSVLQSRTVTPLGSNNRIDLDVRLICATNASVEDMVRKGLLRQDLYYRINTIEINLPPLRERKDDIKHLLQHFLLEFGNRYKKEVSITDGVIENLEKYHWPGNIRELQHAVERAVILCKTGELSENDFPVIQKKNIPVEFESNNLNLSEMEKQIIRQSLTKNKGNLTRTAEELGIGRSTLYRKMEEYGINN